MRESWIPKGEAARAHHTLVCWWLRFEGNDFERCHCSYDTPLVNLAGECVRCGRLPPCDCPLGFDVSDAASSSS